MCRVGIARVRISVSLRWHLELALGPRRQERAVKNLTELRLAREPIGIGYRGDGVRHALVVDVADAERLGLRRDHLLLEEIYEPWLLDLRPQQRLDLLQ